MESENEKAAPKIQVEEQPGIENSNSMDESLIDNFKKEHERLNTMPRDTSKIVIY